MDKTPGRDAPAGGVTQDPASTVGATEGPQPGGDPGPTFDAVLDHLEAWESAESAVDTVETLRRYLDHRLNSQAASLWDRDIVERQRGSSIGDLVVNGEIGVKVVGSVGPSTAKQVRLTLDLLAQRYNFVVVLWLDAASAEADYRRSIERASSAERLGIDGLAFVTHSSPDSEERVVVETGGLLSEFGLGLAVAGLGAAGAGAVLWTLGRLSGLGLVFLVVVASLFVGTIALAWLLVRS